MNAFILPLLLAGALPEARPAREPDPEPPRPEPDVTRAGSHLGKSYPADHIDAVRHTARAREQEADEVQRQTEAMLARHERLLATNATYRKAAEKRERKAAKRLRERR